MTDARTPERVEPVTLAECPIGLFRNAYGGLCLKTEYGNNDGRIDAYIVSSGEFFLGDGPQTVESQRKQLVWPVSEETALTPPAPAEIEGLRPMAEARKDGTAVLLKFQDNIGADRESRRRWEGLWFVGSHPGVEEDGFDIGWQFAAPVGHGGFSDDWFEGWFPLDAIARLSARPAAAEPGPPVDIAYTNYRGEHGVRSIKPIRIFWGSNEWHPEPQWLIEAWDVGKGALRSFALTGFGPAPEVTDAMVEAAQAIADYLPQAENGFIKVPRQLVANVETAIRAGRPALDLRPGLEHALKLIGDGCEVACEGGHTEVVDWTVEEIKERIRAALATTPDGEEG